MDEPEFIVTAKESYKRFKHLSVEQLVKEIAHYEAEIKHAKYRLAMLKVAHEIKTGQLFYEELEVERNKS